MQVILDQDSFYSWFNQAFLFDSKTMLGVWVSESEMRRLADTMAPQRYPCLAMMIPGSPIPTLRGPCMFIVSRWRVGWRSSPVRVAALSASGESRSAEGVLSVFAETQTESRMANYFL
ncbi:hypothetical protein O0544_22675 [Edwardsiella anguillarum]|nr:hypothetical protein [Edwardsiella anguillarum]